MILFLIFYSQYPGIIHVHTKVSNGKYSIEELANLAHSRGIKIVIFTDHFLERYEYGIRPFQWIIKKVVKNNCIKFYGIKKYINEIKNANKKFSDMVLIAGYEVRPYYYWTGNLNNLILHNIQKKFLIIGLNHKQMKRLPIIGNVKLKYNQYNGDIGYEPYQSVIDYVINLGGAIFWSLPEAEDNAMIGRVYIPMPSHPQSLIKTKNYTGFGVIYEGMKKIGIPGGIWDSLLIKYCEGELPHPIWAIGEIDYHYECEAGKRIEELQTIFLLNELSEEAVINALKTGKMYASWRTESNAIFLKEFSINGAVCGDEIKTNGKPKINMKIEALKPAKLRLQLISMGKVIKDTIVATPCYLEIKDNYTNGKKIYYRAIISGDYPLILITNPIFITH